MQSNANGQYDACVTQYQSSFSNSTSNCFNASSTNATQSPGQLPCAATTASDACGVLWVWSGGLAVCLTAASIAVVGAILGIVWLVVSPLSERASKLLRGLLVFCLVAPIIFGGIAGVILCVVCVQIATTNGYFGAPVVPFYVQNAVTASFSWLLAVLGFILCGPTANLGSDDRASFL
jgi:hypothetical protein